MIRMTESNGALCVTIDGEQYENLAKVAASMNRLAWTDGDNTPLSVFRNFTFSLPEQLLNEPGELAQYVCGGIATGEGGKDAPPPLHEQRLAEMRATFQADGLW